MPLSTSVIVRKRWLDIEVRRMKMLLANKGVGGTGKTSPLTLGQSAHSASAPTSHYRTLANQFQQKCGLQPA